MTFEAKQAIREIQTHLFGIDGKMEFLTEPALKGFAFEARRLAKDDFDNAVWRGVAEAADRRREILARYRTGSGVWYASVDVIRWDNSRHTGKSESFAHEKCNSKKEAEEAARRLLAENAKYFSAESSVEARVELSPKVGDGGNRKGGISWGCLTPPLLHRRSDMPCPKITSSSLFSQETSRINSLKSFATGRAACSPRR